MDSKAVALLERMELSIAGLAVRVAELEREVVALRDRAHEHKGGV